MSWWEDHQRRRHEQSLGACFRLGFLAGLVAAWWMVYGLM